MNEYEVVSDYLKEYDICASTRVYTSNILSIDAAPNWSEQNILCFRVYNRDSIDDIECKMCRLSIIEPKYIGAENESFILNNNEFILSV